MKPHNLVNQMGMLGARNCNRIDINLHVQQVTTNGLLFLLT